MTTNVITYTPYALGMNAVTDRHLDDARRTLAYGVSETGWVEFIGVKPDAAFQRGVDHALKQRLGQPDLLNYMHVPPYYPDRLQVWICKTQEEYARMGRVFDYVPPARL